MIWWISETLSILILVQILWNDLGRFHDTIWRAQAVSESFLQDLGSQDTSIIPYEARFAIECLMFSESEFCWARILAKSGSNRRRSVFRWVQCLLLPTRMCLDYPNPTPADAWRHLRHLWDRNQWSGMSLIFEPCSLKMLGSKMSFRFRSTFRNDPILSSPHFLNVFMEIW